MRFAIVVVLVAAAFLTGWKNAPRIKGSAHVSRVVHFEIHSEDPDKSVEFYKELFDWKFTKWDGPQEYWLIQTGEREEPGIDGGMMKRKGEAPTDGQAVNAYVCIIGVENVDESVAKGEKLGAKVAIAKMAVPGVGWLAYMHDPAGNIFGMMQSDHDAK